MSIKCITIIKNKLCVLYPLAYGLEIQNISFNKKLFEILTSLNYMYINFRIIEQLFIL